MCHMLIIKSNIQQSQTFLLVGNKQNNMFLISIHLILIVLAILSISNNIMIERLNIGKAK